MIYLIEPNCTLVTHNFNCTLVIFEETPHAFRELRFLHTYLKRILHIFWCIAVYQGISCNGFLYIFLTITLLHKTTNVMCIKISGKRYLIINKISRYICFFPLLIVSTFLFYSFVKEFLIFCVSVDYII